MIKFENTEVMGWEAAIRGMRNPMNSWEKSDSYYLGVDPISKNIPHLKCTYHIGPNDLDLMRRLAAGGPVHAKYRRMIVVYTDITAPLYWWKEFDTYKVGTVANSCSTMHKIAAKEFTLEDFSYEHLIDMNEQDPLIFYLFNVPEIVNYEEIMGQIIRGLNNARQLYLETKDKKYWWQMIQLLPSSYNQKRTVMLNYEVLAHIWNDRKNHKLDEWAKHDPVSIVNGEKVVRAIPNQFLGFCDWITTLPYSELITQADQKENQKQ